MFAIKFKGKLPVTDSMAYFSGLSGATLGLAHHSLPVRWKYK